MSSSARLVTVQRQKESSLMYRRPAATYAMLAISGIMLFNVCIYAQDDSGQQPPQTHAAPAAALPTAPQPVSSSSLILRTSAVDFSRERSVFPNPLHMFEPRTYALSEGANPSTLKGLLHDGKIYLSLSDAILLALQNNDDIRIARVNLDIADTDILRAKAGSPLRGVSTGLVENTLGGSSSTITGGGGPGGTTNAVGGSGAGASGLVLSTNGGGPAPEVMDPTVTGTLEYESLVSPQSNLLLSGGKSSTTTDTSTFNFTYAEGFSTGTLLNAAYNNSRVLSNNPFNTYSPNITTNMKFALTQHLLQGFGPGMNRRLIVQARNDREITDAAFRQQLLYTINQVENIYWALVSAYEDTQDKAQALEQSKELAEENRKKHNTGALAGLDVINSDAGVASDQESLVASQSNLQYQQLIMKQALVRNLNDPAIADAPIIPTDRVDFDRIPEEDTPIEQLVSDVLANNPQIQQAILNMKNNQITIKAEKNALLPVVDAYAFYGGSALAGAQSPAADNFFTGQPYPPGTFPSVSYGSAFSTMFSSAPDRGIGMNVTITLRNRTAQADQARSEMELEQSQMRLEQLYTQVRVSVTNGRFALTNDRAQVAAARASRDYAAQSLDAEKKKFSLGASIPELVLEKSRSLALAENTLISATATYARDRSALLQLTAKTFERYGIGIDAAARGNFAGALDLPGVAPSADHTDGIPSRSAVPPGL
jgi:outer membrane protein